jgi:hypothetical protein
MAHLVLNVVNCDRVPLGDEVLRRFIGGSGLGARLLLAPYTVEGDVFRTDQPRLLSETRFMQRPRQVSMDLHPDGDRFAFAGGSSPATVTLYRFDPPEVLTSVNISMDVRNAVHGLEIWPFA